MTITEAIAQGKQLTIMPFEVRGYGIACEGKWIQVYFKGKWCNAYYDTAEIAGDAIVWARKRLADSKTVKG
jgi:hypothetical protein